ncbi:hypothetical protein MD484_g5335, partial [Candolleomyces efflorescens]
MFSSGIGGGGFMVVRIPLGNSSEVYGLDFRETAPAAANATIEIRGLAEAHRRWGKLPWQALVKPSADIARGWKIQNELAFRIRRYETLMLKNPDWRAIFAPHGKLLQEGDLIERKNLSRTLEIIANEGPEAFYQGPIADSIISKVQAEGGILTHADLLSYKPKVEKALVGTYRDKKVYTSHAPASGPVLLHMLNLMEHFDLVGEGQTPLNTHRMVEVQKFGFAARTKICDPAFLNSTTQITQLPTKEYAETIFANLTDETTHPAEYYRPEYDILFDHGTSHTSVIDKDGMAVAVTSTINLVFGSQVLDPVTGIILNDEMDDFSIPGTPNGFGLPPSPYNHPAPGKRPLSSTAPTIIENKDGSLYLAVGGAGGSRIFPAIFQVILNLERESARAHCRDNGILDVSQAVEAGRLHNQLYPNVVDVDRPYGNNLVEGLRERGHVVRYLPFNKTSAVVEVVGVKDGMLFAASDSRKNGVAAGY